MLQLLVNGAPVNNGKVVIPASISEVRTITAVHSQGAAAAGKLVVIETSSPTFISTLSGNLDATGRFNFVVGPSFGARGTVNLTVNAGNAKKPLDITYA